MVCRDPRFLWTDLNEQPESITLKWWKLSCQKSMDLDVRTSIFLFCKNIVFQSPPLPWTAKFSLYKKAGIRKWRKCGWPRFWKPKNSKVQVFCFCDLCFQPLSKPGKINGYAPKHSHIQEKNKKRWCLTQIMDAPWKSKTKQRMVFRMIHMKDSLLPMGKVWSLDSLGMYISGKVFFFARWLAFTCRKKVNFHHGA